MGRGPRGYRFLAELRARRWAWVGVAVIIGLSAGLALGLVAGARRSDTAVDRFVASVDAHEVLVISGVPGTFDFAEVDLDDVAALPGVESSLEVPVLAGAGRTDADRLIDSSTVNFLIDPAGQVGYVAPRFGLVDGRLADPEEPNEVVISFRVAESFDLEVGDTIDVNFLEPPELEGLFTGQTTFDALSTEGPRERLRVVGLVAEAGGLAPPAPDDTTDVWMTPAAAEAYGSASIVQTLLVQLEDGAAGEAAFQAELERLGGGQPVLTVSTGNDAETADRSVNPVVRALLLTALLLVALTVVVAGQVLARQAAAEAGDDPTLRALGWRNRDLLRLRAAKAAVIALGAAVIAPLVAVLLSPAFPLGLARLVEPDEGFDVDGPVLVIGAAAVFVLTTGLAVVIGVRQLWRSTSSRTRRPSRLVGLVRSTGAPPSITVGTSLAVQGGPSGALGPLASAAMTVALGVGTVTAVLTFMASLGHLTGTPRLYGWTWDVELGQEFSVALDDEKLTLLREDPDIAALAAGTTFSLTVDGERVDVYAVDDEVGRIEPALLDGRRPDAEDEMAVAPGVADVGDEVTAQVGDAAAGYEVVGHVAVPRAEAMMTFTGLLRVAPETSRQTALVVLRDGADFDTFIERIKPALSFTGQDVKVPSLPDDLVNFGRVDSAPAVVAGTMALVAVATLVHALVTAVRRRRRDVAVLRAIGLTGRQVLVTVAWQATVLVLAALVVAVPVGIAAGRWGWILFAEELKVVAEPVVPVLALAAAIVGSLVLAQVVAVLVGRWSARSSTAVVLRAE